MTPKSDDVAMMPLYAAAARLVPLGDAKMLRHAFETPVDVTSFQELPVSLDVQRLPPSTAAANLTPSDEHVIEIQPFDAERDTDQDPPESTEDHSIPPEAAAASLLPSDEHVHDTQF